MLQTHKITLFKLALLFGLIIPVAYAGITASISGTVTDPTGAVIPGASVTAHNTETGINTSNSDQCPGLLFFSRPHCGQI